MKINTLLPIVTLALLTSCAETKNEKEEEKEKGENKIELSERKKEEWRKKGRDTVRTKAGDVILPAPYHTESAVKESKVIGWPDDKRLLLPTDLKYMNLLAILKTHDVHTLVRTMIFSL